MVLLSNTTSLVLCLLYKLGDFKKYKNSSIKNHDGDAGKKVRNSSIKTRCNHVFALSSDD